MNNPGIFFGTILLIGLGSAGLVMLADHWFTRNWDSIYDPRSRYQIWRDRHQKEKSCSKQ